MGGFWPSILTVFLTIFLVSASPVSAQAGHFSDDMLAGLDNPVLEKNSSVFFFNSEGYFDTGRVYGSSSDGSNVFIRIHDSKIVEAKRSQVSLDYRGRDISLVINGSRLKSEPLLALFADGTALTARSGDSTIFTRTVKRQLIANFKKYKEFSVGDLVKDVRSEKIIGEIFGFNDRGQVAVWTAKPNWLGIETARIEFIQLSSPDYELVKVTCASLLSPAR